MSTCLSWQLGIGFKLDTLLKLQGATEGLLYEVTGGAEPPAFQIYLKRPCQCKTKATQFWFFGHLSLLLFGLYISLSPSLDSCSLSLLISEVGKPLMGFVDK